MTAWLCGCTWERLIKYSQVSGLLKKSVFPFFFPKKGKTNCHLPGFFRAARAHTQEQLGGGRHAERREPLVPCAAGRSRPQTLPRAALLTLTEGPARTCVCLPPGRSPHHTAGVQRASARSLPLWGDSHASLPVAG